MLKNNKILLLGYGNPGRQDDGLGPLFVKKMSELNISNNIDYDIDYQLTLETSLDLVKYNEVIFVDAILEGDKPYDFTAINSSNNLLFNTHSVTPESLINLTNNLYEVYPKAYILAIRGYNFNEFGEHISEQAQNNLIQAFDFMKKYLTNKFKD